jgi:hypothetical protein
MIRGHRKYLGSRCIFALKTAMEKGLLIYFLPESLLQHFTITGFLELGDITTKKMIFQIHLEENNNLPSGFDPTQYESKGFFAAKTIQDFPIRGKAAYLVIKRRRWRHKDRKNETICSDYSFIAEGFKLTKELSDFLKGTGRYQGGYHIKH